MRDSETERENEVCIVFGAKGGIRCLGASEKKKVICRIRTDVH